MDGWQLSCLPGFEYWLCRLAVVSNTAVTLFQLCCIHPAVNPHPTLSPQRKRHNMYWPWSLSLMADTQNPYKEDLSCHNCPWHGL